MRARWILLGLTLLLASPAAARPSSYSRFPGGTKALYMLLSDLGYRTHRIFETGKLDSGVDLLVLAGSVSEREGETILGWVRRGNGVILAPSVFDEKGHCSEIRLGSLVLKRRRPQKKGAGTAHAELNLRPSACILSTPARGIPLVGTQEATVAVDLPLGKGKALVLAHQDLLVNANLDRDDLVVLIRRWLSDHLPAKARVAFLEEQRQAMGLLSMLRRAGLSLFLLHGLVWLVLLYWALAPRFGDPSAARPQTRREFSQHARALGHLYQHRRASAHVLRYQYERFVDRVLGRSDPASRRAGLVARSREGLRDNRSSLSTVIATRTGRDADQVESVLAQVHYILDSTEPVMQRDLQRHFRLSQSLAALQHGSAAHSIGGQRERRKRR